MGLIFHAVALIGAMVMGLMVGNELAVAAFVHPVLYRLPDAAHAQTAKMLAQRLGRVMPVWYMVTFILTTTMAFWTRKKSLQASDLMMVSAALILAASVFSIFFEVPINNRIAAWNVAALPDNWKRDRQTWDQRHGWRVACLILCFALLLIGLWDLPW